MTHGPIVTARRATHMRVNIRQSGKQPHWTRRRTAVRTHVTCTAIHCGTVLVCCAYWHTVPHACRCRAEHVHAAHDRLRLRATVMSSKAMACNHGQATGHTLFTSHPLWRCGQCNINHKGGGLARWPVVAQPTSKDAAPWVSGRGRPPSTTASTVHETSCRFDY
jgi:hypothetical protein